MLPCGMVSGVRLAADIHPNLSKVSGPSLICRHANCLKSISHLHITAVGKSPCAVFGDTSTNACTRLRRKLLSAQHEHAAGQVTIARHIGHV